MPVFFSSILFCFMAWSDFEVFGGREINVHMGDMLTRFSEIVIIIIKKQYFGLRWWLYMSLEFSFVFME